MRSRRRDDGGFVEIGPMTKQRHEPVGRGRRPAPHSRRLRRRRRATTLIDYLVDTQTDEGGFRANTRIPVADVLSTFTAVLTLADLGVLGEIDVAAARRYVQSMELPDGGFLGGVWDSATDGEYTFYGLGGLGALGGVIRGNHTLAPTRQRGGSAKPTLTKRPLARASGLV